LQVGTMAEMDIIITRVVIPADIPPLLMNP
jgi:hypothetical protein